MWRRSLSPRVRFRSSKSEDCKIIPSVQDACFSGKFGKDNVSPKKCGFNREIDYFACNLKKILALVLAFACAFTMFAGAAFTDQADIKVDSDVVDTLVSLGVVNGYTDGSFKPNDTVTRAEMAKMIYVLRTGNSDASAYNDDYSTFTDINGHWARGYVKYCQSLGIIAGQSATKFAPDQTVTAQEAAKMLLVTLGYDATKAGLVGAGWASKTNALADENGLLEDVNTSFTGPCPRQYAAQLMYNAIDTPTVVWRDDAYTNVTLLGDDNQTVGEKYMGLASKADSEGILSSVKKEDGKDTFRVYVNGVDTFTKVATDYSALLGQKVHVLYKDGKTDKVYGIYATDENTAVTALVDDVDDIDKTVGKVKIDGTSYKTATANAKDLPVYVTPEMDKFTNATTLKALADDFPYFTATFVDYNDDDKLDYAIVTPFVPAQIDNLSSSSITVSRLDVTDAVTLEKTAPKLEDVDLYEGAAEDDYVAVVNAAYSVTGNTIITKMGTVSGKVSATRNNGSDAKVDDTWYSIVANETVENNDEYDFATIGKFVFAIDATATSVSASNILYVGDVAAKDSGVNKGVEADVYFADGTSKTVTLTKLDGDKFYENGAWDSDYVTSSKVDNDKLATALKGQMFKFTKKSDTEYEIKALTIGSYDKMIKNEAGSIDEGKVTVTGDTAKNFRMADDAVVFVTEKNGDVSVKTGKSVNNWNTATTVTKTSALTKKTNGFQYAKIACLTINTDIPSSSDYLYGYVVSKVDTIDNDGTKYQFTIWNGEKEVTLTTEDDDVTEKGTFIAYSMDGDLANIELTVKNVASDAVAIMAYDDDDITFSNRTQEYEIDDDCVVIGVNTEDKEGVAGVKLATAKEMTKGHGDYWKNAVYFVDGGKVTAIFVDTQGKMYDKSSKAFLHI